MYSHVHSGSCVLSSCHLLWLARLLRQVQGQKPGSVTPRSTLGKPEFSTLHRARHWIIAVLIFSAAMVRAARHEVEGMVKRISKAGESTTAESDGLEKHTPMMLHYHPVI